MSLTTSYTLGPLQIRINWPLLAGVLMVAAVFVRLGLWQLDRAAEKVVANEALQAQLLADAQPLESIPATDLRWDNAPLQNRFVMLEGEYDNARTILILAEFFDGQIGYGVVTPLRLQSTGQLALVSRGWTTGILPQGMQPILRPVDGPVRVGAQIHLPEREPIADSSPPALSASPEWPLRVRGLNIGQLATSLGEPLFPFELRITENQPGTLVRHWPATNPEVGIHLFYALQWFLFSALALIAALLASSNLWQLLRKPTPQDK